MIARIKNKHLRRVAIIAAELEQTTNTTETTP